MRIEESIAFVGLGYVLFLSADLDDKKDDDQEEEEEEEEKEVELDELDK